LFCHNGVDVSSGENSTV